MTRHSRYIKELLENLPVAKPRIVAGTMVERRTIETYEISNGGREAMPLTLEGAVKHLAAISEAVRVPNSGVIR